MEMVTCLCLNSFLAFVDGCAMIPEVSWTMSVVDGNLVPMVPCMFSNGTLCPQACTNFSNIEVIATSTADGIDNT